MKQVTIHVPACTFYYMSGGEQKKATTSGNYLVDAGSIFAISLGFNGNPNPSNATLLTRSSSLSVWKAADA